MPWKYLGLSKKQTETFTSYKTCTLQDNFKLTSALLLLQLSFADVLQKPNMSFNDTLHIVQLSLHVLQDVEVVNQDSTFG